MKQEQSMALTGAEKHVAKHKLPKPRHWTGDELDALEFPRDLSAVDGYTLGELLGTWTSVMAYVQYEVAKADVERTAHWNRYEFARKKRYLELVEHGGYTEEGRKAQSFVDTAELRSAYEQVKAKHTLLDALLGSYTKYYQALSRELSRRGLDGAEKPPQGPDEYDVAMEEAENADMEARRERLTKEWKDNRQNSEEGA